MAHISSVTLTVISVVVLMTAVTLAYDSDQSSGRVLNNINEIKINQLVTVPRFPCPPNHRYISGRCRRITN